MPSLNIQEVREMAYDLYKGRTANFDKNSANEAIKNIILEAAGCADKWDMYKFMDNKYKVFAIMREILTPVVAEAVNNRFDAWVDIEDIALGDTKEFDVLNMDLFEIGYVADGTSELRRQKLVNGKLAMTQFQLGAKIYTEFDDFRRGRVDFNQMIDRLALSFEAKIGEIIVKGVEQAYDKKGAFTNVAGAFATEEMLKIVQKVEAKAGQEAVIYGTKVALAELVKEEGFVAAESDLEEIKHMGHVGMWHGCKVVEIPQFINRKDQLVLNDNLLYVIPNGTKIVKILFEGDVDVIEVADPAVRKDMQFEYMFMRRLQMGIAKASVYGVYQLA
jgi:hypothetical protein